MHLRLRLARPCVHLRCLAMTCPHFGRDQICTQADASFSLFGHSTQVNLLSGNEIQDMSASKWFFCDFCVLARKLASPFGHPRQVSRQVQLVATCDYLRVCLTRAFSSWIPPVLVPPVFVLQGCSTSLLLHLEQDSDQPSVWLVSPLCTSQITY